ncbi:ferritin heavy chain [Cloeon dipterum]|uniref:ferritin heavy chain n=1 Tax=Cloeon dipterum TaxID=197152 RepID=UPI0032208277
MMLILGSFIVVALLGHNVEVSAKDSCAFPTYTFSNNSKDWNNMKASCVALVEKQVQVELHASMTYLAMGAHFSRDTVNRPGFAKLFFEAASEEREHATKFLKYLSMRGQLTKNLGDIIQKIDPLKEFWENGVSALEDALSLEVHVTRAIKHIIKKCDEEPNDYHFVDYLTTEFLDEQHKGQRDLAGKLTTLGKMKNGPQRELAEFLFDKKLLNGEV